MKAIFIVFNQAVVEKVEYMLDTLKIRGFSQWENIQGRGSKDGNPHYGTHTWPEINIATLAIVEDDMVDIVLEKIQKIDEINKTVGIRAFVWNVERTV
jgi:nitrogen regulatory protein PII